MSNINLNSNNLPLGLQTQQRGANNNGDMTQGDINIEDGHSKRMVSDDEQYEEDERLGMGMEEQEDIDHLDLDEYSLKKFITYFELTRRDYINLFKKVLDNQPDMLEKLSPKLLQIIMAKENKVAEFLGEIDEEMGGERTITEYFLDPYAFEKRSKIPKIIL